MWVLDKIRGSVETSVLRQGENGDRRGVAPPPYSNVLTPDKIPDFFIPPKLVSNPPEPEPPGAKPKDPAQALAPELDGAGAGAGAGSGAGGRKISSPKSPGLVAKLTGDTKNLLKAANRHIIQIESADDVVPGDTNADPQSQTAMSLPYVAKTQTPYGFATLKESPHTRRKESLFHCEHHTSPITSPSAQRRGKADGGGNHLNPADLNASHINPYRYFSGGESDTCSSAESSPFGSPLLSRSASLLKIFTQETQAKVSKAKRTFARHSSLSTDECSSAEPSPNVPRRRHQYHPGGGGAGASNQAQQREHTITLHKGGTVRISANYDAGTSRLLIRVLAAESLYDRSVDIKSIHCCVSVYLKPGKLQKQRSNIIKNSRNPVFNEDFFFDSISPVQAKDLSLKFKVVNKGTSLKRDTLLGEREVPLTKLLSGL